MFVPGYLENVYGRRFGKYRAIVKDIEDPEKRGRVKVRCVDVFGDDLSPWAEACVPGGVRMSSGWFDVPPLDALVWIEFEQGLPERPIYSGGYFAEMGFGRPSDGTPAENSEGFKNDPNPVHPNFRGMMSGTDLDGGAYAVEGAPDSAIKTRYGYARGLVSPSGHQLFFDDTPNAELVRLVHRSGTIYEIRTDGGIVEVSASGKTTVVAASKEIVKEDKEVSVNGNCYLTVGGDYTVNVLGTYRVLHNGVDVSVESAGTIDGDWVKDVLGSIRFKAQGSIDLLSADGGNWVFGGDLSLSSGGSVLFRGTNFSEVPDPLGASAVMEGVGGWVRLRATDSTGLASSYGVEARGEGLVPASIIPTVGQIGPLVRIGNIKLPALPDFVPLLQEPAVLGLQLQIYLNQLQAFLQGFLVEYGAHVHAAFGTPAPSVAASLPALQGILASLTTMTAPSSSKAQPILLSDSVAVTK
jgi:hypothetical protein